MGFVQIYRGSDITPEQWEQVRKGVLEGGPIEGEIFSVAGETGGELYVIDGWESQEACHTAMSRYMPVIEKAGISMEGMPAPVEFDTITFTLQGSSLEAARG
jgi:hypothetical protein